MPSAPFLVLAVTAAALSPLQRRPTALPSRPPTTQLASRTGNLVASSADLVVLSDWEVHDYANLAALPPAIILTVAALVSSSSAIRRVLALYMVAYIAFDAIWIAAQPSAVKTPLMLLAHHAVTLLLLLHPLTHELHLKYVPAMTVVEVNTFLLIVRRHAGRNHVLIEAAFALSWLAIRVVWFPCLAAHLACCAHDWGSAARHAVVSASVIALAALQLHWTIHMMKRNWKRWTKGPWLDLRGSAGAVGFL